MAGKPVVTATQMLDSMIRFVPLAPVGCRGEVDMPIQGGEDSSTEGGGDAECCSRMPLASRQGGMGHVGGGRQVGSSSIEPR